MGNVVRFVPKAVEPRTESTEQSRREAYLSVLAESAQAARLGNDQIKKDVAILQSIAQSTENPLLRQSIQTQLNEIRNRLLLVTLNLLSAKDRLDSLGATDRVSA